MFFASNEHEPECITRQNKQTNKHRTKWSDPLFHSSDDGIVAWKCCPRSPSFINPIYALEMIETLFFLWVDSCVECGLTLTSLSPLLKPLNWAHILYLLFVNVHQALMNVCESIFPHSMIHLHLHIRCHFAGLPFSYYVLQGKNTIHGLKARLFYYHTIDIYLWSYGKT